MKIFVLYATLFVSGCAANFDHQSDNQPSTSDSGVQSTLDASTDSEVKPNLWQECQSTSGHLCANKEAGTYVCSVVSCPQPTAEVYCSQASDCPSERPFCFGAVQGTVNGCFLTITKSVCSTNDRFLDAYEESGAMIGDESYCSHEVPAILCGSDADCNAVPEGVEGGLHCCESNYRMGYCSSSCYLK